MPDEEPAAPPPSAEENGEQTDEDTSRANGKTAQPDGAPTDLNRSSAENDLNTLNQNNYYFYREVDAREGTIGVLNGGEARERPPTAAVGRIDATAIAAVVDSYVPPATHDEAIAALAEHRVLVLSGDPLIGKRHAAIKLLREATQGPLVLLSPTISLESLGSRTYEAGHGYAAIDWCDIERGREGGRPGTEFEWLAVRGRVQEAGAHLVVTTAGQVGPGLGPGAAVPCVRWDRPSPRSLLARLLDGRVEAAVQEQAAALIPAECSVPGVVRIAERLAAGLKPDDAVSAVLELVDREHVETWFDKRPDRRQIAEVAVLALVPGVRDRRFEELLGRLESELAVHLPPPGRPTSAEDAPAVSVENALPQVRTERADAAGLIERYPVPGGGRAAFGLRFKKESYRSLALTELWRRFDSGLWDAVNNWLRGVVKEADLQVPVATGLALLSAVSFEEVESQYLEPWSRGALQAAGQLTAVFVLSHLSLDDDHAATALRIATRWVSHGNQPQRWTAAMVFSGELGARYPTDAARRLWQLIPQTNGLSEPAALAMGRLFATLVYRSRGAAEVIRLLGDRLAPTRPVGRTAKLRRLILTAICSVLSGRDPVTGHPSAAHFLADRPDQATPLGGLWAATWRNVHHREQALESLAKTLICQLHVSDAPHRDARLLSEAVALPLDRLERGAMYADASGLLRQRGWSGAEAGQVQILLTVLREHPTAK
ncbi:hypothetical protein OHR68_41660 [Spirillospora sp. NBC_00431]